MAPGVHVRATHNSIVTTKSKTPMFVRTKQVQKNDTTTTKKHAYTTHWMRCLSFNNKHLTRSHLGVYEGLLYAEPHWGVFNNYIVSPNCTFQRRKTLANIWAINKQQAINADW